MTRSLTRAIRFSTHFWSALKEMATTGKPTIATYFRPKIDMYDINFFGLLESILYYLLDNYENTNLMLITDSLSYAPITKIEELGVAVENPMDEGMFLLFMNERSAHAL
jgi:hypothetical protein